MLNKDTKNRIDSARQILVGKIPDPKAQVEQITTAMIYKFMYDMDLEAEELGGNAKYFTGDLKEFAWGRLLSRELSGQERLDTYTRALIELSKAQQIPELFRIIFKDAFLPYRDPETLNLFLKEINEFTYENSENLGNAFEYLLSVLGSQGDAGQFRTPRHVIDFIVEVVDPKKGEKVLDPACGTAGFLISAYKHIRRIYSSNFIEEEYIPTFAETDNRDITTVEIQKNGKYKGDKLTPDDKKKLAENIVGYDISPDMVRLSLVNLYLHDFNSPQIFEYDTLTYEDRWDDTFDVILANPPFMTPKGGIRPHKRFQVQANRAEVLFVDYIAEHLKINGRAGIIVPEGVIFQSSNAYKALRKMLVEDSGLYAVVSLPSGVFQPYSGVKTSILFLNKEIAKNSDEVLFVKIENDGFDLGSQRRRIDKNDLPRAFEIIKKFEEVANGNEKYLTYGDLKGLAHTVHKDEIAESGDYNLSGERYKKEISVALKESIKKIENSLEPYKELFSAFKEQSEQYQKQIQEIQKSIQPTLNWIKKEQEQISELYKNITTPIQELNKAFENINFDKVFKLSEKIIEDIKYRGWDLVNLNDICEIKTGKKDVNQGNPNGKYPFFTCAHDHTFSDTFSFNTEALLIAGNGDVGEVKYFKGKFEAYQRTYVLFNFNKVNPKYLYFILHKQLKETVSSKKLGNTMPYIKLGMLTNFKIPLPPIDIQKQIVEELESYQKIIDGAKQVIENWKPDIKIDPEWEIETISNIATLEYGIGESAKDKGEYRYIRITDIGANGRIKNTNKKYIKASPESDKYILNKGDLLIARTGATYGKTLLFNENEPSAFAGFLIRINFDSTKILSKYFWCFAQSEKYWKQAKELVTGGGQPQFNANAVKKIKIPLPSIETQKQIVEEIENEQKIVDANKQLIKRFENKIEEKIMDIWGI